MPITISDYVDVYAQANALGLIPPSPMSFLPRGFAGATSQSELVHESETSTLRKLLKASGVTVTQLDPLNERLPIAVEKAADWISPTVFIGALLYSQNPVAVHIALGVLTSYISDLLKSRSSTHGNVRLTFVVERQRNRGFKKLDYEGPVSGLSELSDIVRRVHDEEN